MKQCLYARKVVTWEAEPHFFMLAQDTGSECHSPVSVDTCADSQVSSHADSSLSDLENIDLNEIDPMHQPTFRKLSKRLTVKIKEDDSVLLFKQNARLSNDPSILHKLAVFCIENSNESSDEGFEILRKLAQKGNIESMYYLGLAYTDDDRHSEAYYQYSMAAKKFHHPSMHAVGKCAEFGIGCKKSKKLAIGMYSKAATAGNQDSMLRLGLANLNGELGLSKNINLALKWFKRGVAGKIKHR